MSWMKPWEYLDEMDDMAEEFLRNMPKEKPKPHNKMRGQSYTIEYSKSARASCKVCTQKIAKLQLRIGKEVEMTFTSGEWGENQNSHMGSMWFHYDCFWGASYRSHSKDPAKTRIGNFVGFSQLTADDQKTVYLQITGRPMPDDVFEEAVEKQKEREVEVREQKARKQAESSAAKEENAMYLQSDPFEIAQSLVDKWLCNCPKADEVKSLVKMAGLTIPKGKKKKADHIAILKKQRFSTIPSALTRALGTHLSGPELKVILKNVELKVSGNKTEQLDRLCEYLRENQPLSGPVQTQLSAPKSGKENDPVAANVITAASAVPSADTTQMKPVMIQSGEESIVRGFMQKFCSKYLRNDDLKAMLDELEIDRKKVNRKQELVDLVVSQDLVRLEDLAFDSMLEFASEDDFNELASATGVQLSGLNSSEEKSEAILKGIAKKRTGTVMVD